MKVRDPYGQTWRVTRRWVPWRRRTPLVEPPPMSDLDGPAHGDDLVSVLLRLLPLAVVLLSLVVMGAVAVAELLLMLLVLPVAVLGRVLLGRQWVVEVGADHQPVWEIDAGSWDRSREAIHELGAGLRRGAYPWHTAAPGLEHGRVLEDWILTCSTSDHATFGQRRPLRLGHPAHDAGPDDREEPGGRGPGVRPAPPPGRRRPGAPGRPRARGSAGPGR